MTAPDLAAILKAGNAQIRAAESSIMYGQGGPQGVFLMPGQWRAIAAAIERIQREPSQQAAP